MAKTQFLCTKKGDRNTEKKGIRNSFIQTKRKNKSTKEKN